MRARPSAGIAARVTLLVAWWTIGPAAPARADWLITPFVGTTFGASTAFLDLDAATTFKHIIFGASGGWLSDTIFGLEGEYAHAPRFFEGDEGGAVLGSQVTTLSGNVMVAAPLAVTGDSLRPFLLAGLGLVHSSIEDEVDLVLVNDNSLGLQLGGGAIGFVSDRAALRFDLRHIRTLSRTTDLLGERAAKLSFWRAAIGVAIRY